MNGCKMTKVSLPYMSNHLVYFDLLGAFPESQAILSLIQTR